MPGALLNNFWCMCGEVTGGGIASWDAQNADRYSIPCSWSHLDHSLNLQTPHQALRGPPRRSCGAPEHRKELSNKLSGPNVELANTSRTSQAACQDRIPSSWTSRGALKQPPRNEFRAPKQASQEESNKQTEGKQASEQPSKQASNRTSKRASEQTSKRTNEQTN